MTDLLPESDRSSSTAGHLPVLDADRRGLSIETDDRDPGNVGGNDSDKGATNDDNDEYQPSEKPRKNTKKTGGSRASAKTKSSKAKTPARRRTNPKRGSA